MFLPYNKSEAFNPVLKIRQFLSVFISFFLFFCFNNSHFSLESESILPWEYRKNIFLSVIFFFEFVLFTAFYLAAVEIEF